MTHQARRRNSVADPTAQALARARRGDARHPGQRWEAIVGDVPAESCSGQLEALLRADSEFACVHVTLAVQRDGWPSIAHYRTVTEPDVLRCGLCVAAEDLAALARPEEHVRPCDCCGRERVTAGLTYVQAATRTVWAWLCAECSVQEVPGLAVLETAAAP